MRSTSRSRPTFPSIWAHSLAARESHDGFPGVRVQLVAHRGFNRLREQADGNQPRLMSTIDIEQGTSRRTAADIFAESMRVGEEELKRSSSGLAFSGIAAGLGMGLTGLGAASLLAALRGVPHADMIAALLYPLGFIVVIVGRAQLFTENTLFPVILVLDRRRHLRNTGRLWAVVFGANVIGALLFALLAVTSGALDPSIVRALAGLGHKAVAGSFGHLFWSGVAGGWII